MTESLTYVLTFLYSAGGIITLLGFIPTVKDLWKGKPSANISTYITWTITLSFTMMYGIFVLKDLTFISITILHWLACLAIVILAFKARVKHRNNMN